MSTQPRFRKYCEQGSCRLRQHKLMTIDNYKQQCPVCSHIYDPFEGMSHSEKNQFFLEEGALAS